MNMYSILDRSTFEESCVRADQGIAGQFPSREFSDQRSTDWIHPWTVFLSCGKTFSLHFPSIPDLSVSSISRCILTAYTANRDDASTYNSRLSTAHKARVALGGNTTITVDDDFSQAEMMRGLDKMFMSVGVMKDYKDYNISVF